MPDESSAPSKASTTKLRATPKPRAITRKSKAEREEYARHEAERAKERAAQDAAQASPLPSTRSREGTTGVRGGGFARKTDRTSAPITHGVFGAGSGARPERSRGPVDVGQSEALEGQSLTKSDIDITATRPVIDVDGTNTGRKAGAGGRGRANKAPEEEYVQMEEDDVDEQPRRDIERIWISSDEDEDAMASRKGKHKGVGRPQKSFTSLRPVRAASTVVEVREDGKEKTRPKMGRSLVDNAIVDVESDEMQVDELSAARTTSVKRDIPPSPELTRKTLRKSSSSSKPKDARLLAETLEEKAERLRFQEDIQKLRDAFLQKSDLEDTVESHEEDAIFGRTDHERMFLFQLPPLVPQLFDPATRQAQQATEVDDVRIKAEDVVAPSSMTQISAKSTDQSKSQVEAPPPLFTAEAPAAQRFPQGLVGKLNVHQSGKVTLDWGGTDMEVRYGTGVDFLQDVVCVDTPPTTEDTDGLFHEREGQAYAMGQVKRKMVLVPDWSKLYA